MTLHGAKQVQELGGSPARVESNSAWGNPVPKQSWSLAGVANDSAWRNLTLYCGNEKPQRPNCNDYDTATPQHSSNSARANVLLSWPIGRENTLVGLGGHLQHTSALRKWL